MSARQRYEERRQQQRPRSLSAMGVASLLLMGLLLGLAGGLAYAWLISPVVYVSAGPSRLRDDYQEVYIFLVAQSYALDGD